MRSNLVSYVCRSSVHVRASRAPAVAATSPVTVHEGEWAYCPAGASTEHEWEAIEPVNITELKVVGLLRHREVAPEDSRS
jgi:hypothetical protein